MVNMTSPVSIRRWRRRAAAAARILEANAQMESLPPFGRHSRSPGTRHRLPARTTRCIFCSVSVPSQMPLLQNCGYVQDWPKATGRRIPVATAGWRDAVVEAGGVAMLAARACRVARAGGAVSDGHWVLAQNPDVVAAGRRRRRPWHARRDERVVDGLAGPSAPNATPVWVDHSKAIEEQVEGPHPALRASRDIDREAGIDGCACGWVRDSDAVGTMLGEPGGEQREQHLIRVLRQPAAHPGTECIRLR